MKNYIITTNPSISYDGSIKPRTDIADILSNKMGFQKINYPMFMKDQNYHNINEKVIAKIPSNSVIYFQFPSYTSTNQDLDLIQKAHDKKVKIVAIVHDINSLRGFKETITEDVFVLNHFDLITLPSISAANELKNHGLEVQFIIQKGPFDFITSSPKQISHHSNKVSFAGNLSKEKAGFLASIGNVRLVVYGSNLTFKLSNNSRYAGERSNEELIPLLTDGYGLLWDGDGVSANSFKKYEKYNWQYKLSLYLAAGILPIADINSNVGKWIIKMNCGVVLHDLSELKFAIDNINTSEYQVMLRNVIVQQIRVRTGYYTIMMIKEINASLAKNVMPEIINNK